MRERRVDVDGLLRDAALFSFRKRCDGAHVGQPVRERDEEDTDIRRQRHEHLAQRAENEEALADAPAVGDRSLDTRSLPGQFERQQIRVREITVVVRLLFAAHRYRLTEGGIPEARLLAHTAAEFAIGGLASE